MAIQYCTFNFDLASSHIVIFEGLQARFLDVMQKLFFCWMHIIVATPEIAYLWIFIFFFHWTVSCFLAFFNVEVTPISAIFPVVWYFTLELPRHINKKHVNTRTYFSNEPLTIFLWFSYKIPVLAEKKEGKTSAHAKKFSTVIISTMYFYLIWRHFWRISGSFWKS